MIQFLKRVLSLRTILVFATILSTASLILAYLSPFVHPNTFSYLPFFGLGYILILATAIICLIFWLILKSKWSLFVLFIIVLGGKLHFRTFALGSNETVPENHLSVMSYNVRLFDLYNKNWNDAISTRNEIFSYIAQRNCDITCFQEFYHQDKPTKFETRDSLIKLLDTHSIHERYAHKNKGRQNFGVTILSKYPMIERGNVNFSINENNYNYCIYADIVKNKDTFRIYNVHLQSIKLGKNEHAIFEDLSNNNNANQSMLLVNKIRKAFPIRANQAEKIIEHIDNSPYPAIVCGDFNDTPMSYVYNQFSTKLTDVFRNSGKGIGVTYAGKIPAGRIDYIFHSKLLHSSEFNIQKKELSDHLAVDCKIFK